MTNEQINYRLENYLRELDKFLAQIPMAERSDIILELNGHITESLKTKSIDEVLSALGKPEQVANRYLLERGLQPIPKKKGGCFKWGCLGVVAFFLVLILAIVLLVRGFFPLIQVNDKEERVKILGGLIDVDGVKETVKIGGLIDVVDDNSPVVSKEIPVGDFSKIRIECFGDVEISQGDRNSVVVQATQKNFDWVDVRVEGETLVFDTKRDGVFKFKVRKLKFLVTLKELSEVALDGSGDVLINPLQTRELALVIDGHGDIHVKDLKASSLRAKIEGAGDMVLSGTVEQQSILIEGAGDYKARDFTSKIANVKIEGSGDVLVNAISALNVEIEGSGDVRYTGSPSVAQSIEGSGTVTKAD
jgi:hypothetical protein